MTGAVRCGWAETEGVVFPDGSGATEVSLVGILFFIFFGGLGAFSIFEGSMFIDFWKQPGERHLGARECGDAI